MFAVFLFVGNNEKTSIARKNDLKIETIKTIRIVKAMFATGRSRTHTHTHAYSYSLATWTTRTCPCAEAGVAKIPGKTHIVEGAEANHGKLPIMLAAHNTTTCVCAHFADFCRTAANAYAICICIYVRSRVPVGEQCAQCKLISAALAAHIECV